MRILVGTDWRDDFLDPFLGLDMVRIRVAVWKNLEKIDGLYFVRDKSFQLLWNYCKEIGLRQALIKVISRLRERLRNDKYVSCGLGFVLQSHPETCLSVGQAVVFIAPNHAQCLERVVLVRHLVAPCCAGQWPPVSVDTLAYFPLGCDTASHPWWGPLRGWSEHAGQPLVAELCETVLEKAKQVLAKSWPPPVSFNISQPTVMEEGRKRRPGKQKRYRKTAVLFGYGNYAKTIILPNIRHSLEIHSLHEIDPTQIPPERGRDRLSVDTSPWPRNDEKYDVYFIAGYHHTHAPLAVHALGNDACAVVEKPLATTWEQLQGLLRAMEQSSGRLFTCFHKRYSLFNAIAYRDLGVPLGEAISYHCIVYEEPLPALHWYRWPSSCSRLVSNGCHWLDHFLFLNNFCDFTTYDVFESLDGTLNVIVQLENGAFFSMILTDVGSRRIGVQDYVELRVNDVTVKIVNGGTYCAENSRSVLRRKRLNKLSSYASMYRQIALQIATGQQGDSQRSVEVSTSLVLSLEDKLMGARKSMETGG